MQLKVLFLGFVRFLTLTQATALSPCYYSSKNVKGNTGTSGLDVCHSKLSLEAYSLPVEKRTDYEQRPEWISEDVWNAINTMVITSNLPSTGNSRTSASNSSSPFPSLHRRNETDSAGKHKTPFDDAPYPDFDPFGDLHNEDTTPYASAAATLDFFELTTANVQASKAKEWYAQWTIERRSSPRWEVHGEWPFFVAEFTGVPNFTCSLGNACRNYMGLGLLVQKYPRNPELVRRIWIIENYMVDWHDFNSITDQGYLRAVESIGLQLPTLISAVTTNVRGDKSTWCKIVHSLLDVGVQVAVSAIGGMVGGAMAPYFQEGQSLFKLQQNFGSKIVGSSEGSGQYMTFNWWQSVFQQLLMQPLYAPNMWVGYGQSMTTPWGQGVDGGKGNDPMCSSFEGDLQISVDANVKRLQDVLAHELDKVHRALGQAYRDLFNGKTVNITKEGEMSTTARMFMNQKWNGDDSVAKKVENPDQFQADFEIMMAMKLMSTMASLNHQYQKCSYDDQAQEKCAKAAAQSSPCVNPTGGKYKNCQRAVICPRPEEPNLICKSAAWYYAVEHGHETELPHLESWEGMFGNRDEEVFKWNRTKMLESTYDFYELYHNNFDSYDATFGINAQQSTRGMAGLQIPVCLSMSDDVANGRFPVGCGRDWRADETFNFMNRLGMGEGSQVYNDRDAGFPNELFVSVIPDALDHHYPQSVSPVSHYVTMYQLKIRHPDSTLDRIFSHDGRKGEDLPHMHATHMERDKACDLVMTATAEMSMDQADEWFCGTGAQAHSVFDREMYMTVSRPLLRTYDSHKKRCKNWRKGRKSA